MQRSGEKCQNPLELVGGLANGVARVGHHHVDNNGPSGPNRLCPQRFHDFITLSEFSPYGAGMFDGHQLQERPFVAVSFEIGPTAIYRLPKPFSKTTGNQGARVGQDIYPYSRNAQTFVACQTLKKISLLEGDARQCYKGR
jgi:hypothetical protein